MKNQTIISNLGIFCLFVPAAGFAQSTSLSSGTITFSPDMVFTFLFLTLGPLKIIRPFWLLTKDRDVTFSRKLALTSSIIALIAAILATTVGTAILVKWRISPAAIALTAGLLLFLIALEGIMKQYGLHKPEAQKESDSPEPAITKLAFAPLAFPTIVTPYGVALLIALATLAHGQLGLILGLTAAVFVLNYLTMLVASWIMKWSIAVAILGILGAVMGVLQVALGVQTIVNALHSLE